MKEISTIKTPIELTLDHIERYQQILNKLELDKSDSVLKISRKDRKFSEINLPFSAIKYSGEKGFYILATSEEGLLGKGDWGKVKLAYYCDENAVINPNPLAIKIEKKKILLYHFMN